MDLRKFRKENNLTQKEFARIIGVPRSVYQRWESQTRLPSYTQSAALLNAIKKIIKEKDGKYTPLNLIEESNTLDEFKKPKNIYKYILLIILIFLLVVML